MKWVKKNDYYLEHIEKDNSFSIAKTISCDKTQYTLWKLPYNAATMLFRSESLHDVKAQALQHYKVKSASIGG